MSGDERGADRVHRRAASLPPSRDVVVRRAAAVRANVRLSVVVPSYNTAEYVCACVRSILRQTVPDLEVIVVDDGSTDDSVHLILAIDDPRLVCVTQPNQGLAAARNTGILLASGRYVGFCDSDDLWHPRKAERHLAAMDADPSIGLTFSFSEYLTDDGWPTGDLLVSSCVAPTAQDLVLRNHVGNGSTPVVRGECFVLAGLFDETLNACADLEMWFRIAALTPLRLLLVPEVLTGYRMRGGSMTTTYDYFLADARRAAERFASIAPALPPSVIRRGYAESLRIASRKAFAAGDIKMSRQLLGGALREYPYLPVQDWRALSMLLMHVIAAPLPERVALRCYAAGRVGLRQLYGKMFGSSLRDQSSPWADSSA